MTVASTKISTRYRPLYTTKKRYTLITGGRGSLKTSTVQDFVARLTYERGHGILYTRYTMQSAETSIIPEFRMTLERLGISHNFRITRTKVINRVTGSFIYFSGIKSGSKDHTAKLKGLAGITTWIIEEGEDFNDEKAFDIIDDSIRTAGKQNRVIWIQNPTTREHFIYKRLVAPSSKQIDVQGFNVTVSNMPQVEHIHTTYHLAEAFGYLEKSWLAKAERAKQALQLAIDRTTTTWTGSPEELKHEIYHIRHSCYYYSNYIGGWLERAEGVIFTNWIEGEFDTTLPYCNGLDFGFVDPLAMLQVAVDRKKKRIYVKERIYESGIIDIIGRLQLIDVNSKELIVADNSEPRTIATIAKDKERGTKFNIEPTVKFAGVIVEDIREIKQWLIVVDPESKNIKMELNNYAWDDKKAEIPIDAFNHLMDGLRYAFRRLTMRRGSGAKLKNAKRVYPH